VTQRLISGAVLVAVVGVLFVLGPPVLTIGIALLAGLAAYETSQLVKAAGLAASTWFSTIAAPVLVLGFAGAMGPNAFNLGWALVGPAVAIVIILAALIAFRERDPADGFRTWVGTILATLYPSLLGFAAAFIGLSASPRTSSVLGVPLDQGRIWLLILVLVVWTVDSGAYLSGKLLPRGHFMNHISPNKTWSGAIGGTIAAVVVGALLLAGSGLSPVGGALLGFVIAVAAQAGDITESMLKRAAGAKDSGTLIPGHGGFLDRVDSFLFASPVMFTSIVAVAVFDSLGLL
jgi:phosphatidate cytidylyltransferase